MESVVKEEEFTMRRICENRVVFKCEVKDWSDLWSPRWWFIVFVRLCCRADEGNDDLNRFIQCGVDRCLLHRTLDPVNLLLRCLEQRCAAALPQGSNKVGAGMEKDMGDGKWRTSNDCAAACHVAKGIEYEACLRQSCGTNQRPAISAYCQSVCHIISPENLEQCLRRYCPVVDDQEDQGSRRDEEDFSTEPRMYWNEARRSGWRAVIVRIMDQEQQTERNHCEQHMKLKRNHFGFGWQEETVVGEKLRPESRWSRNNRSWTK